MVGTKYNRNQKTTREVCEGLHTKHLQCIFSSILPLAAVSTKQAKNREEETAFGKNLLFVHFTGLSFMTYPRNGVSYLANAIGDYHATALWTCYMSYSRNKVERRCDMLICKTIWHIQKIWSRNWVSSVFRGILRNDFYAELRVLRSWETARLVFFKTAFQASFGGQCFLVDECQ